MQFSFSRNPIINIKCWLSNEYEKLTQIRWIMKHHRVICHICGDVLDSAETPYSPEQCGWKRLNSEWHKPWVCHTCLEHRNFKPFIKEIDKREEDLWKDAYLNDSKIRN